MNLNRALIVVFGLLFLFLVITVINLEHLKSSENIHELPADTEILITNINCLPEVIRSYDRVKDVYGKKNTLFFRYSKNSCSSCINYYLAEILALQEEIGKDYVWIFPAFSDDRNSRIQLSSELAKYNYRNISADSLIIPIYENEQKSYFGWINNEGEIDMVFIPEMNKGHYLRNFFFEVKRKKASCEH